MPIDGSASNQTFPVDSAPPGSWTKGVKLTRRVFTVGVPGGLLIVLRLRAGHGEEIADRLGDASDSDRGIRGFQDFLFP
jgi:hypothetical protein